MYLYVFICFILHFIFLQNRLCLCENDTAKNLTVYLSKRSDFVLNELNSSLPNKGNDELPGIIQFGKLERIDLNKSYSNIQTLSFLNASIVLMDNELYFLSNSTSGIRRLKNYAKLGNDFGKNASFVRTAEIDAINILLAAFSNHVLNIYGFLNDAAPFGIQTIVTVASSDAHFFKHRGILYLIVTNNKGAFLVPTIIYKWTGAYFDKVDEILTEGATSVSSFTHNEDEIIVITQNVHKTQGKTYSVVYRFEEGRLRKLQLLKTENPKYSVTYRFENTNYVVIVEERSCKLYVWNERELTDVILPQKYHPFGDNIFLAYVEDYPLLFSVRKNESSIYMPVKNSLRLTSYLNLNDIKKILDMKVTRHDNNNNLVVIASRKQNTANSVLIVPFSLRVNVKAKHTTNSADELIQCMKNLIAEIGISNNSRENKKQTEKIVQQNELPVYGNQTKISAAAFTDAFSRSRSSEHAENLLETDKILRQQRLQAQVLRFSVEKLIADENTLILNGKVIIEGKLNATKLTASNLHLRKINNLNWTPNDWLSYSKHQVITGPVMTRFIDAKHLQCTPLHKNLVLVHGNQFLNGKYQITNLKAGKVFTSTIGEIPVNNLYMRSRGGATIKGKKTFDHLKAPVINVERVNQKDTYETIKMFSDPLSFHFKFDSRLTVKNLQFSEINGVHWNNFTDSVFRFGATKQITGNLKMKELSTHYLHSNNIANNSVDAIFTSTTNQTVKSNIYFSNIDVPNVICNTINHIDIGKQAATSNELNEETIDGPVNAMNIAIDGNLHLMLPENKSVDHIKGSDVSDLLQIYHKPVTIYGNLHIKNVLFTDTARLSVHGQEFIIDDMINKYWLKHQPQRIPINPVLHSANVPHLSTKRINDVYIGNYMTSSSTNQFPPNIHFKNITVVGNILLNPNVTNYPNLQEIHDDTVKTTGKYIIKGRKRFLGEIRAKNVNSNFINNVNISNVFVRSTATRVTGKKTFKNIVVDKNLYIDESYVESINGINLKQLKNTALYIDLPVETSNINFLTLTADKLYVSKLNGVFLSEYALKLEKESASRTLRYLRVDGNLTIKSVSGLSTLNKVDVKSVIKESNERFVVIDKQVEFPGTVYVNDIDVFRINSVDIMKLFPRLLLKRFNQNITARHSFNRINTHRLYALNINNVSLGGLINVKEPKPQYLRIDKGLDLRNVKFSKSLNALTLFCELNKIVFLLHNPINRYWEKINVSEQIVILDSNSKVHRMLNNVFTKNADVVIEAPITFEGHILANNVYSDYSINGINITDIATDVLLKDAPEKQVVTGEKIFISLIAEDVFIERNADIRYINNIDVLKLNASLVTRNYEKNYALIGSKTLAAGLRTERFRSNAISEVDINQLVFLENLKPISSAAFDQLIVTGNLSIRQVNDLNLSDVLRKRVQRYNNETQRFSGIYLFKEMHLQTDSVTPFINDIQIEDVVVDDGLQIITGNKIISNKFYVRGDLSANRVNGHSLKTLHQQTIFTKNNETIKGNININRSNISGRINVNRINGVPVLTIKEIMKSKASETLNADTWNTIKEIDGIVDSVMDTLRRQPDKYIYIDRSEDLQISLPNSVNARAVVTGVDILIHVDSEISGDHCGLPSDCTCNVQHTVHVTPENSANIFLADVQERVFSYSGEGTIVHLFTNSISRNSHCRSNTSKVLNEFSALTWTSEIAKTDLYVQQQPYDNITGYISGVEYFSIKNQIYVVACRYYDPVLDTHDLDCMVMKISKMTNEATIIQRIPTRGAWITHLFHTAQGIVLIIGNVLPTGDHNNYTQIHRFDTSREEFLLLRTVKSIGCTSAAGIVLGEDSLIILVQHKIPIQVLKYNHHYDNYYFYQSFQLEAAVRSVSTFYVGGFGIGDAYLSVVTEDGDFYVYSFHEVEGWQIEASGALTGLQNLVPFDLNERSYLFAPSSKTSSLLIVRKYSSIYSP